MKLKANEKLIITADLPEPQARIRRGPLFGLEPESHPRRRGDSFIVPYDLAWVNRGTQKSPDWGDHPVLKTPAYTASIGTSSSYEVEPFTTADYAAYTAMLFEYPVEEWHWRYRAIEYEARQASTNSPWTSYPSNLTLANKGGVYTHPFRSVNQHTPTTATTKAMIDEFYHADPDAYARQMLSGTGLSWWERPGGGRMPVRGLPGIKAYQDGYAAPNFHHHTWFPFNTENKVNYKVTAVNDPGAPDVGVIKPSGLTRVFMVPHIGLWFAITTTGGTFTQPHIGDPAKTVTWDILGPVYQVTPRHLWPRYVDRTWAETFGTFPADEAVYGTLEGWIDDPDGRKADFLAYQKGRAGMQASAWRMTAANPAAPNPTDLGPRSPDLWPHTNNNYLSYMHASAALNESGDNDNFYGGRTAFTSTGGLDNFDFFEKNDPFLTAVIQKGSNFYYVWMLPEVDVDGIEYSVDWSNLQDDRYKLTLRWEGSLLWGITQDDDTEDI